MTVATSSAGLAQQQSVAYHLDEFRAALEEQRAFRTEQLAELALDPGHGQTGVRGDAGDEVNRALRAGATRALGEIEAAIVRIDNGTFGACSQCGAPIPFERLEVLPMSALCMRCAHAQARGAK